MTVGFDLLIRAPRAICGGAEISAAIGVRAGRIAAVAPLDDAAAAPTVIELTTSEVLLPGPKRKLSGGFGEVPETLCLVSSPMDGYRRVSCGEANSDHAGSIGIAG